MATEDSANRQKQSALRLLDHTVDGLVRRQRRQLYLRCLSGALFWGLVVASMVVFVLRLVHKPHSVLLVTVLFIIVAAMISVLFAAQQAPDKLGIAIVADEKLAFKQRLSTAWEYRESQPDSEITSALALQAGGARLPSVSAVFPFELNLWGMLVPLAVCLLVLANLVPLKAPANSSALTQVDKLVVAEGVRLETFARRMKQLAEREGYARSLAQSVDLQQLGAEMKSSAVARKQALQRLQRLQRSITAQGSAARTSAALGESANAESKYHTDNSSSSFNDALDNALSEFGAPGLSALRDRLSAGRLSPEDLKALNRSLESLDGSGSTKNKLREAIDRYSQGEPGELQQILNRLSESEKDLQDAEELDRARVAILQSRENLGDDSRAGQGGMLESEAMAFAEGGDMGDDGQYVLSEFPGDATGGGLGMSQDIKSVLIPGQQGDAATAQSTKVPVTLKPEAKIKAGESFRSETWVLPEDSTPTVKEEVLDSQFENQVEAVLAKESYPLHQKELVRRYFLNLSNGPGEASVSGSSSISKAPNATGETGQ